MRTYTMRFEARFDAGPPELEFVAENPGRAFSIAQRESANRPVELWEGGKRLGKLTPLGAELWQID